MLTRRPASLAMCKLKNSYAATDVSQLFVARSAMYPWRLGRLHPQKVLHTACGAYNPGDCCSIGMDGAVQ